jgi:hypothetical protein
MTWKKAYRVSKDTTRPCGYGPCDAIFMEICWVTWWISALNSKFEYRLI